MDRAILTYITHAMPQHVAGANLKFFEVSTKAEYNQLLKELGISRDRASDSAACFGDAA